MTHHDRACLCKQRFETREAALAEAAKRLTIWPLYAYRCLYGNHWHLTKKDVAAKQRVK